MADEKSKVVYGVLAIILGWLGIHKFYVGDTKNGIIYLILGICTGGGIGSILGLITGIMALTKSDEEFHQRYVVDKSFI
jgi:TM2 domain-containing membrane protein YozV